MSTARGFACMLCAPLAALVVLAASTQDKKPDEKALKDDLAKIQGRWSRTGKDQTGNSYRGLKEITGNKETVTFSLDGDVKHVHTVDFKLDRTGKVRTFTYSNMEITEGPNKGVIVEGDRTYIYAVKGNHFVEVDGLLLGAEEEEPSIVIWDRVKD